MLSENIKRLRAERGMSQEGLAQELHVVRQTVSKWEKGLSVPDAELLVRLAEVFGVTTGELLGEIETAPEEDTTQAELRRIAARLEEINAQLAARSARNRKILRIAAYAVLGLALLTLLIDGVGEIAAWYLTNRLPPDSAASIGIIGGADGPTAVFIAHGGRSFWTNALAVLAISAVACAALWKTRN